MNQAQTYHVVGTTILCRACIEAFYPDNEPPPRFEGDPRSLWTLSDGGRWRLGLEVPGEMNLDHDFVGPYFRATTGNQVCQHRMHGGCELNQPADAANVLMNQQTLLTVLSGNVLTLEGLVQTLPDRTLYGSVAGRMGMQLDLMRETIRIGLDGLEGERVTEAELHDDAAAVMGDTKEE